MVNKIINVLIILLMTILITLNISDRKKEYTYADLQIVQLYIMNDIILNEDAIKYYDINKDEKVSSLDYVLIKDRLKGENKWKI